MKEPVTCLLLVSCLAFSSTLKLVAVRSSKISMNFYQTIRRYIPEDSTLHSHRYANLKSNTS
jgi:hypothetical protein